MQDCRHRRLAGPGSYWPFVCRLDGGNYSTTAMIRRCHTCPLRQATPHVAQRRSMSTRAEEGQHA